MEKRIENLENEVLILKKAVADLTTLNENLIKENKSLLNEIKEFQKLIIEKMK